MLAEICNGGYTDALHFLLKRGEQLLPNPNLFSKGWSRSPETCVSGLLRRRGVTPSVAGVPCCEARQRPHRREHQWLDLQVIQELPLSFRTGVCVCVMGMEGAEKIR